MDADLEQFALKLIHFTSCPAYAGASMITIFRLSSWIAATRAAMTV